MLLSVDGLRVRLLLAAAFGLSMAAGWGLERCVWGGGSRQLMVPDVGSSSYV